MYFSKINFGRFSCVVNFEEERVGDDKADRTLSHCHAQYEIHIPIDGEERLEIAERKINLCRREALLIAPGVYHSSSKMCKEHNRQVISFLIYDKEGRTGEIYEKVAPFKIIEISEFCLCLTKRIAEETRNKDIFRNSNVNALCTLILSELFGGLSVFEKECEDKKMTEYDRRFSIIDDFFEQDLANNATEAELARKTNLSLRQLGRVLRTYYNMSFREKLCQARMKRAEILLTTTEMTIGEICESVGYNSEQSFFKTFKKLYKKTPGTYRKENS